MSFGVGDSLRRRRGPRGTRASAAKPSRPPLRWGRWILAALLAMSLSFAAGYGATVYLVFPSPVEAGEGVVVPRLVGRSLTDARRELVEHGLTLAGVAEISHPGESAGVVIAQSPVPGQRLREGGEVQLAISAGPLRVQVPDLVGFPGERAEELARRLGFQVAVDTMESLAPLGQVLSVRPTPGTEVQVPIQIVLSVSAGPPPVEPDTFYFFDVDTTGLGRDTISAARDTVSILPAAIGSGRDAGSATRDTTAAGRDTSNGRGGRR